MGRLDIDALAQNNGVLKEKFSNRSLKRQAIHIVNNVSGKTGIQPSSPYENWSWDDLYREAADMGVKNCARLTKRDLIASLKDF